MYKNKFHLSNIFCLLVFLLVFETNTGYSQSVIREETKLNAMPFNLVKMEDNFWSQRFDVQASKMVPYALDKTIPAVENLEKAAKYLKGDTTDLPFPHRYISSDLYKVMEGAAYILQNHPDSALEARMDGIIDIISQAQKDDGYLYVAHITGVSKNYEHWGGGGMGDKPYSFVLHSHELYNLGHMYEGAVAYHMATGKTKWLDVAEKSARHVNNVFFEGDPNYNDGKPVNQAPGHEEIELALIKLYKATGNKLYVDMADKFLAIRGKTYAPEGKGVMAPTYAQQHLPVSEQRKAVGHAVRAAYLYSAMADVTSVLGIHAYDLALDSIWHNIADTRMHITGGLGAIHGIEGFGPEYVLPNKEAYNETCAAVGNVLFNYRMFMMTREAKYMDIAEVALFNNVLAGVNLEGNKFFYVNPLESDGETPFNQGTTGRAPWFNTACCPTNLARLIPQIPGMMYSYDQDEIFVTLYAGSETTIPLVAGDVHIEQKSEYPFDEVSEFLINPSTDQQFKLKLRIPTWAQGRKFVPGELYTYVNTEEAPTWNVEVNGQTQPVGIENGFATIDRVWHQGDKVKLVLGMKVHLNKANEKVEADKNRNAITRGPLVYCAESLDADFPVQKLFLEELPEESEIYIHQLDTGILSNITAIRFPLSFQMKDGAELQQSIDLIPYFAWNNRGNSSMSVWLPTESNHNLLNGEKEEAKKFAVVKASSEAKNGQLNALAEAVRPKSSADQTKSAWVSLTKPEKQWIEIKLERRPIRSIGVYWYSDGKQVSLPSKWTLEYKNQGKWYPFEVYVTDQYSLNLNQYNIIHPASKLECDEIRINMELQKNKAVGILDVDVAFED